MANLHVRSKSLPSESHPSVLEIEDHLCRLKSSEATSTSSSTISTNLASIKDLYDEINNIIQLPSIQSNGKWAPALLDESLRLVDLCGFARDLVFAKRESIQELQSSIRRNRSETATSDDLSAYEASRRKIKKMVKNCIKNSKSFNKNDESNDLKTISGILRETDTFGFSVLKSVLVLVSEEKGRSNKKSWSLLSKFSQTSHGCDGPDLKQLKESEMITQEIEEGLESLFRSLVKTRVSLLNLLNH